MTNKTLLNRASACLQNASYSPKKLAFFHAGIAALVTFLGSLFSYLMTNSMDAATGLAGIGTRTVLSFFRSVLLLVTTVAMPFWQLGYTRAAVLYAQEKTPTPTDLLTGFRRFFPALRLALLRTVAVFAILFFTLQAATVLFMLSPFSLGFMQQAEIFLPSADMTEEMMAQLLPSLLPVYILWGVLALVVTIPLFYKFRLAHFALMDNAQGAIAALRISLFQTKGKCLSLFKLDLHFWWYYLLSLVCAAVSYLDLILPRLGVAVNADIAFWVFFLLGQLLNISLHTLFTPKVQTAYALFLQPEQ